MQAPADLSPIPIPVANSNTDPDSPKLRLINWLYNYAVYVLQLLIVCCLTDGPFVPCNGSMITRFLSTTGLHLLHEHLRRLLSLHSPRPWANLAVLPSFRCCDELGSESPSSQSNPHQSFVPTLTLALTVHLFRDHLLQLAHPRLLCDGDDHLLSRSHHRIFDGRQCTDRWGAGQRQNDGVVKAPALRLTHTLAQSLVLTPNRSSPAGAAHLRRSLDAHSDPHCNCSAGSCFYPILRSRAGSCSSQLRQATLAGATHCGSANPTLTQPSHSSLAQSRCIAHLTSPSPDADSNTDSDPNSG